MPMTHSALFTRVRMGRLELPNRLVMAPLTRLRSGVDGVPDEVVVEHYRQRASMGLIVTEGTWPVQEDRTWFGQPGIETPAQVAGWRRVADAVHAAGGRIAMQVMHGGRVSHPEVTGTGRIVSASATATPGLVRVTSGKVPAPVAHALSGEEIPQVVAQYVAAAERAVEAGMDAVELHGANGYLIHQFLSPASNHRTDAWGGTPARRARFAIDVTRAVAQAIGADRTGIRLSPEHVVQGMDETAAEATLETYATFAEAVAPLGLAFIDILHAHPAGALVQGIRRLSRAPIIANTGFATPTTRQEARWIVEENLAEAVGVGRAAIANPDLVRRWRDDLPENAPDPLTFYDGGPHGYIDYPTVD